MKKIIKHSITSVMALVATVALFTTGCTSTNTSGPTIAALVLQEGVATGASYALTQYTNAVPFIEAATPIICSAANGTNFDPAFVVNEIDNSPQASSLKTPEGALILNSALTLYIAVWDSYGASAVTNSANMQLYLTATCNGLTQAVSQSGGIKASSYKAARKIEWPLIKP